MTQRYLLLSDVHSNLEALEAVLRTVRRRRYDAVLCMGDLVGYGANPEQVLGRVRKMPRLTIVRGNHDKVCCGLERGEDFNASARASAQWTASRLRPESREHLRSLPKGPASVAPDTVICHGSVTHEDRYLFSDFDAYEAFEYAEFRICFFGHTHIPCVFQKNDRGIEVWPLKGDLVEVSLDPGSRYLINPGSVGQPRDRTPKASFGEFYPESNRFVLRRVEYDVEKAARKILRAGLPPNLANRLKVGS
jgi:predicted phosphodiesterase